MTTRHRGRPTLPPDLALTERLELRLSAEEKARFRAAARELGVTLADATREALDEWYADFHERRLFDRRREDHPVAVERRRGLDRRRVHLVTLEAAAALTT